MKKTIDAMGQACPKPVILTKQALDEMEEGTVDTRVDNEVSKNNLMKLAENMALEAAFEEQDGAYLVTMRKTADAVSVPDESITCDMGSPQNTAPCIAVMRDTLGSGSDELGAILMKSFLYTVSQTKPLPQTMLFLNGGVNLTTKGSPVLEDLRALSDAGVEIISCGTCLDFFNKKEDLELGEISNMYTIYEKMAAHKTLVIG